MPAADSPDRQFAVSGVLNKPANMIPVSLYLSEPARQFTRRFSVDMVQMPEVTPMVLYMYVLSSGAAQMGDLQAGQGTFTARMVISTDKYGDIEQHQVYAPKLMAGLAPIPLADFYQMSSALMENPFEKVKINKVFVDIKYSHERNIATIEKATRIVRSRVPEKR